MGVIHKKVSRSKYGMQRSEFNLTDKSGWRIWERWFTHHESRL